jgi:hypothetical protein
MMYNVWNRMEPKVKAELLQQAAVLFRKHINQL